MPIPGICSLCGRPAAGPTVDPGPALGRVHRSCFRSFDRRCEAEERGQVAILHLVGREPVREELRG